MIQFLWGISNLFHPKTSSSSFQSILTNFRRFFFSTSSSSSSIPVLNACSTLSFFIGEIILRYFFFLSCNAFLLISMFENLLYCRLVSALATLSRLFSSRYPHFKHILCATYTYNTHTHMKKPSGMNKRSGI